jgi:hypothetical protein
MVLLEWKKLNPKVSIVETKKKFFNSYYYNIKYFSPGGRIILTSLDLDVQQINLAVSHRIKVNIDYNYGGSWRVSKERTSEINCDRLFDLYTVRKQYSSTVRFRVEEPYITIYGTDESELYEIAQHQLKRWTPELLQVTRPRNEKYKELLDQGAVLVKSDIGYQYKFICKDGVCSNKKSIGLYLEQLGDQVKVSRSVQHMLSKNNHFIWGVWFYAKDPSIANMLNIIEPNLISNIHEVVMIQE